MPPVDGAWFAAIDRFLLLADHRKQTMQNENTFNDILDTIKADVKEFNDLSAAIRRAVPHVLDAITVDIGSAGAREFRSFSIQQKRYEHRGRSDVPGEWMFIVRAIDRSGDEVVCFHTEQTWETAVISFCIAAGADDVQWKVDDKRGKKVSVDTFFESLPNGGGKPNGEERNVGAKRKGV